MRPHELCELPKMVHLISSFTIKQVNWKLLCTAGCNFFLELVIFLLGCKKIFSLWYIIHRLAGDEISSFEQ